MAGFPVNLPRLRKTKTPQTVAVTTRDPLFLETASSPKRCRGLFLGGGETAGNVGDLTESLLHKPHWGLLPRIIGGGMIVTGDEWFSRFGLQTFK
jgi:hypothetical protein